MAEPAHAKRGLEGLRVLLLESRRATELARLIAAHGGTPIIAPSMREVPVDPRDALGFADRAVARQLDICIFLTGVGTRLLFSTIGRHRETAPVLAALREIPLVARGPKSVAALREFSLEAAISVPEPNTWRDILAALDAARVPLERKRVALQEYGASNRDLIGALRERGAEVHAVRIYNWALPEDTRPLELAARQAAEEKLDVVVITSATQIEHFMQVAETMGLQQQTAQGLQRAVVASVGPITTEALQRYGLKADLEPAHPRMGQLVFELAGAAAALLAKKRSAAHGL